MNRLAWLILGLLCARQDPAPRYETRERHDPNGINKWYLGREIAHVMGPGGIPWLDRPEREDEENPARCIESLRLKPGDVVADLGAGSGYYSFRLAPIVGERGKVLAVEIQDEMIAELKKRIAKNKIPNVETIKCTVSDPMLPEAGVDLVILVDVYHELEFPYEVMSAVKKALKPGGRVAFVEFRKEDPGVPIKEVHKMSEEQIGKEMAAVGLHHLETIGILPWQHIAVYTNRDVAAETGTELAFRLRIPDGRAAESARLARETEWFARKALASAGVERFTARSAGGVLTLRLPGPAGASVREAKEACLRPGAVPVPLEVEGEKAYGQGR
jgi:ubiquinone/menaquinone biosynthesis C-methylase UbiE